MLKSFWKIARSIILVYLIVCGLLYMLQENLIFIPEKLDKDYRFDFEERFEEIYFPMEDGVLLNGLLFQADSSKGVILYLHGNAGSLRSWGVVAPTYLSLNYDLLMIDYRGYGKSGGAISGESQLFSDMQSVYDELKKRYDEKNIIVLGYSIGTGPAAKMAATNRPKMLILQAPYYSLVDMMRKIYPIIPTFILKYKLETHEFIQQCKMPVVIFHGKEDEVIYYGSSLKLKALLKPTDTLITLEGQGHNGITYNEEYLRTLRVILAP